MGRLLRSPRSIHAKFLVSFLILLIPPLVFGLAWVGRLVDEQRDVALVANQGKAERTADRLTSLMETVGATLMTVAEVPSVREMDDEAGFLLASVLRLNPSINNIYLLDRNGNRVAAGDPDPSLTISFADRYFFKAVMGTGQPAVGEATIAAAGRAKGRPVIHIARPLRSTTGTLVGVIAASLSLETMEDNVIAKREDNGSYLYVVDGRGNIIVHPDKEYLRSIKNLADMAPVAAAIKGERGVMNFTDPLDGQPYLTVYRPITSTPWGVVSLYPLAELQSERRAVEITGALAIFFSLSLALLLATLVTRPIASSIGQLAAAAKDITAGKLGTTAIIKRRDEIGALAQTFNTMSLELAEMVDKLEEQHRQLQISFHEVGEALASGLDLRLTLEVALRSAAQQLGMGGAAAGLLDDNGNRLHWAATSGTGTSIEVDSSIDISESDLLLRQTIATMAPTVPDRANGPSEEGGVASASLALPLVSRDRCLGVFILLDSNSRPPLRSEEIDRAQAFANQVAVAVDNARAHSENERLVGALTLSNEQLAVQNEELQVQNEEIQAQSEEMRTQTEEIQAQNEEIRAQDEEIHNFNVELQARNRELQRMHDEALTHMDRLLALTEVSRAVSGTLDLDEVCQQAMESAARVMGSPLGSLYTVNWEEGIIEVRAVVGVLEEVPTRYAVFPIDDQTASGRAALSKKVQRSEGAELLPSTRRAIAPFGADVVAAIPIICKDEVVGVISLSGYSDRHATQQHVDLLMTIANVIGVAIDNARLYSGVKELDQLKEDFMSIASHELRTPLTSVKGYAQLLTRKAQRSGADETDLRALQIINEQADRMTRLVNELLDVSRMAGGRLELQSQEVELGLLLRKVVDNIQITTEKHQLHLDLPADRIVGVWDEGRVGEVLQNLMDNAMKYSPKGGGIWVSAVVAGSEVEVSVRDEGIGISKANLPRVFERFYQGRTAEHRNYGGIGLGLYISSQTIHRHGGRIWVESQEGQGSTFRFTLPLLEAPS